MTDPDTLQTLQSSFEDWLVPGITALLSVAITFVAYKEVLSLVQRITRSNTVSRLFLDASATALGVVITLVVPNGLLETFPSNLALLSHIQQVATLSLIVAVTWALVCCTSAIGNVRFII